MRKIKIEELSKEAFEPFGSYYDLVNPDGYGLGQFYPDRVVFPVNGEVPVTVSALKSPKDEVMKVTSAEFHNKTGEGVLCLNDDVVIHVSPASDKPVPELTRAFFVPKGTFVKLNVGVWHLAALPVNEEVANILILLPQRTYNNDCTVVEYSEEDQMELIF